MLDSIFKRLNLSAEEAKVYLVLLQSGDLAAGKLAKSSGFPRSSLYGFLSSLSDKGLVSQSEENGVKLWHAAAPEQLAHLIDREIDSWDEIKKSFEQLLPVLKGKQAHDAVAPRFQLFEGVKGVKLLLNDLLLYRDITTELVWPITEILTVLGEEYLSAHNRRRIRQKIFIKSIWPQDKAVDIKKHNFLGVGKEFQREIREAPPGFTCTMGYWAYENKVAFISSEKESFGFLVESKEFRMLMKAQFDQLWPISKNIEVPMSATKDFLKTV
jgi:sugar-specific transcriptional regulator TrmB